MCEYESSKDEPNAKPVQTLHRRRDDNTLFFYIFRAISLLKLLCCSGLADALLFSPPPFDAPPPAEDGVIASEAPEAQLAIPPPSHLPPSFDEAMAASGTKGRGVGYNSALLVDPSGELVGNYRKAFLYDADRPWALEGPGFRYFDLPQPLGRLVVGVCMGKFLFSTRPIPLPLFITLTISTLVSCLFPMGYQADHPDLNPKDFLAPWNAYELSGFAKRVGADTLVVPMNWLEPELDESDLSDEEREELENLKGSEHPCLSNLNYWAARCTPLHDPSPGYAAEDGGDAPGEGGGGGEEVVFVAANRSGEERGTTFSGSSAVMRFGPGVELVEALSRGKEGVLIAHVL